MERINGADTIDIGGGRRGFKSQNAALGIPGTEVTDKFLNDVQEELCKVITEAGLTLDPENQQQLWEALLSISAPGFANRAAWLPVLSITTSAPPGGATTGDAYIIPAGATGAWAGHSQKYTEWTGVSWRIVDTKNGHGISLPDGRVFEKIDGVYNEKIALDVQSGKWLYASAGGTANVLTATLTPMPSALVAGMAIRLLVPTAITSSTVTLNVNGLGAKSIYRKNSDTLLVSDIAPGLIELVYDGAVWRLMGAPFSASSVGTNGFIDLPGGITIQWGKSSFASGDGGKKAITLPKAFSGLPLAVTATDSGAETWSPTNVTHIGVGTTTATSIRVVGVNWNGSAYQMSTNASVNYMVIGPT